jgi:hypothetical protein
MEGNYLKCLEVVIEDKWVFDIHYRFLYVSKHFLYCCRSTFNEIEFLYVVYILR